MMLFCSIVDSRFLCGFMMIDYSDNVGYPVFRTTSVVDDSRYNGISFICQNAVFLSAVCFYQQDRFLLFPLSRNDSIEITAIGHCQVHLITDLIPFF